MSSLTTVPSLDELAGDPGKAIGLPVGTVADLLDRVSALHSRLQATLTAMLLTDRTHGPGQELGGEDRLLNVEEAAHKLGTSIDWLYRSAQKLPFTVRNGRQLRFSDQGIDRWIKARQGRA